MTTTAFAECPIEGGAPNPETSMSERAQSEASIGRFGKTYIVGSLDVLRRKCQAEIRESTGSGTPTAKDTHGQNGPLPRRQRAAQPPHPRSS